MGGDTHLAVAILGQYNRLPMQITCFPKKAAETDSGSYLKMASESLALQQSLLYDFVGRCEQMSIHPTGSIGERQKKQFHPSLVQ